MKYYFFTRVWDRIGVTFVTALAYEVKLTLNAFIVSGTAFADLLNVSVKKAELEDRNVLFMEDGGSVYLNKLFERLKPRLPTICA